MAARLLREGGKVRHGGQVPRRHRKMPEERKRSLIRSRRIYTILIWILGLLALVFLWSLLGLMMRIGFLPAFDLGYGWFDAHVVYFFGLSGK